MAGFSRQKAYAILGVPAEEYDIMAAVAIGYRISRDVLPEEVAAREQPNSRKPFSEVAKEGQY